VWLLGGTPANLRRLTNPEDVARVLAGGKPHLMVTDPPYGVKYDPAWRVRAGHGSEGQAVGQVLNDDRADWREAWALFPGDVAYIWHAGSHCGAVANSLEACGSKSGPTSFGSKHRRCSAAAIIISSTSRASMRSQDGADEHWHFVPEHEVATYTVRDGKPGHYDGGRKQSTVWNIEHVKSETGHGTQKPVEAMRGRSKTIRSPASRSMSRFPVRAPPSSPPKSLAGGRYAIELNELYVDVGV
jgi:DNA modification methylase